jgi:hypothetical protein
MFPLEDFIFHMNFKQSFYGMRALSTGVVLELPLCEVRELVSCNTHCRYEEAVLMFEGEFHKKSGVLGVNYWDCPLVLIIDKSQLGSR